MFKKKNFELELDDYVEDEDLDYEDSFYNAEYSSDNVDEEEERYKDFFKVDSDMSDNYDSSSVMDDDDSYEADDHYDSGNIVNYISIISTWFIRLGIAIAVILVAVFISQGNFKTLFLYIIGLVVSFFFGYFFMYLLNKFNEE